MSRPERNDVDYFPHEVDHGRKMFFIENKYQNDGYATWFKILEELGKTDFHFLDLSEETTVMYLSAKCRVDGDKLLEIINDLVKLEEFNRYFWEEFKILWDQSFVLSIRHAYYKRKTSFMNLRKLSELLELKVPETVFTKNEVLINALTDGEKPQRKEEKSIENNSIENNSIEYKENDSTDFDNILQKTKDFYQFYISDPKNANDDALKAYRMLVSYLLDLDPKRNPLGHPVWHILKIQHQLKFEDFKKLREKGKIKGTSPFNLIVKWTNKPKYTTDQLSIYSTLDLWLDNEGVKQR